MSSVAPAQRLAARSACRALVEQGLWQIAQAALQASEASLSEQMQACSRPDLRIVLHEAAQLAADPDARLTRDWTGAFMARFDAALDPASKPAPAQEEASSAAMAPGLSLVSDEDLQDSLERSRLAQRIASRMEADAVSEVRVRLAELAGSESLRENDHPLAPSALFEALDEAARRSQSPRAARVLLLEEVAVDLPARWEALIHQTNALLVAEGILPRLRASVRRDSHPPGTARRAPVSPATKTQDSVATAFAGAATAVHSPNHPAIRFGGRGFVAGSGAMRSSASLGFAGQGPDAEALQGALQQARSGQAQAHQQVLQVLANEVRFGALASSIAPVKAALLESLATLQQRLQRDADAVPLSAIAEQLHRDGSVLDQVTADIVSMVFDYIDADRRLADSVKRQLLRLQVVAIKAALLDRAFFARRQHPLRQLIDAMSDAGADPEADLSADGLLIQGFQSLIDQVISTFDTSLDVFEQAITGVQSLVRAEAQRRREARRQAEQAAARQEVLTLACDEARGLLSVRCEPQTPLPVRSFLNEHWVRVMARTRLVADPAAAERAWAVSLKTAELLLWSVRPKQAHEISRLATLLPTLLRAIQQGMDAIGLPPAVRETFLSFLMQTHTREISQTRRGRGSFEAAPAALASASQTASGSLSAVARTEASADVDVMDQSLPPAASGAQSQIRGLEALVRGGRYEIDTEQGVRTVKLAWISPARRLFIFSAHPEFNLTLEAEELARRLSRWDLRPLAGGSGFEGILAELAQPQGA